MPHQHVMTEGDRILSRFYHAHPYPMDNDVLRWGRDHPKHAEDIAAFATTVRQCAAAEEADDEQLVQDLLSYGRLPTLDEVLLCALNHKRASVILSTYMSVLKRGTGAETSSIRLTQQELEEAEAKAERFARFNMIRNVTRLEIAQKSSE